MLHTSSRTNTKYLIERKQMENKVDKQRVDNFIAENARAERDALLVQADKEREAINVDYSEQNEKVSTSFSIKDLEQVEKDINAATMAQAKVEKLVNKHVDKEVDTGLKEIANRYKIKYEDLMKL